MQVYHKTINLLNIPMTMLTLYKATELARLELHIDPDTGEIDVAAWDAANITLAEKQKAVIAYIKNQRETIKAIKAHIADMKVKEQLIESQQARLNDYLNQNMLACGISEIKANDGTFSAKLHLARDQSVSIDEGAVFDEQYLLPPKPRDPNKKAIKAAIEAGISVNGARIEVKDRLEIK